MAESAKNIIYKYIQNISWIQRNVFTINFEFRKSTTNMIITMNTYEMCRPFLFSISLFLVLYHISYN